VPDSAASLRWRASRLEQAARSLRGSSAASLHLLAGSGTWQGPTARRAEADLVEVRARLFLAADDLDRQARSLRLRAAAVEATVAAAR
jgi:hypothetical protein